MLMVTSVEGENIFVFFPFPTRVLLSKKFQMRFPFLTNNFQVCIFLNILAEKDLLVTNFSLILKIFYLAVI